MKQYVWHATSNDGSFYQRSNEFFNTKKECYNDMRNKALEKMKWNTEFDEDFENKNTDINYSVIFSQNKIVHESYSGIYTYVLHELELIDERENFTLYREDLGGGKARLYAILGTQYVRLVYDYCEGEYFPMDVASALTCRWYSE